MARSQELRAESAAMAAVERAFERADTLPEKARARVYAWANDHIAERSPQNQPPIGQHAVVADEGLAERVHTQ